MFIFKTTKQMKKIITFILLLSGMASYAQVKPKQITPGSNGQAIMVRNGQTVWDDIDWADIANKPTIPQGTVTSVGLAAPTSIFNVTGSPVTSSGTLTISLKAQPSNTIWAGPASGTNAAPDFRALVVNDIPNLPASKITSGTFATARLGSGTANASKYLAGDGQWTTMPTIGGGTVTSVTGTAPISVATGTTTPVISITKADGSTDGYLSSGDWTTFNNKASLSDISASAPLNWNSTTGNMTITRGNLVAGSNVTLSGTIANRLVGSGNVTINADVSPGDIYGTEDTITHVVVSGDIASGVVSITLAHAVKAGRIPEVWINGVKARWAAITTTGTTLKITNSHLPYNVTAGDEVDIKYVY